MCQLLVKLIITCILRLKSGCVDTRGERVVRKRYFCCHADYQVKLTSSSVCHLLCIVLHAFNSVSHSPAYDLAR